MESSNLIINDSKSDEEEDSRTQQLEFQDIPHTAPGADGVSNTSQTHVLTNFPNPDDSEEDDVSTLLEGKKKKGRPAIWTFAYYQSFFNVNTNEVLWRILFSMIPNPRSNFLQSRIQVNPDLYGPFWTCTTLIFAIAVTGNIASYISHSDVNYKWHYDFRKVTLSATAIYTYWWLMPTLLYALFWWRHLRANCTFTELLSIYGYSLFIYIPISVLWMIPVSWLQWLLVMLGMVLSGSVLLLSIWPIIRQDKPQISLCAMLFVILFHGALAIGFMLYFFHVPPRYDDISTTNHTSTITMMQTTTKTTVMNYTNTTSVSH